MARRHPARELIARRYLKFQPSLAREALARLTIEESRRRRCRPSASTLTRSARSRDDPV
jgi:hypothetical protein